MCPSCGGVYLDATEFDAVIAQRFAGVKLESTFAFTGIEVADALQCSGCGAAMHRVDYDELEIDQCPDCGGIWLDGHERGEFARRAQAAARSPDLQATVGCGGCGAIVPERICIRRMDQFWCEDCVVAGNHPGREAALVGSNERARAAAMAFASAKGKQSIARARNSDVKLLSRRMGGIGGRAFGADRAMYELGARAVNWLFEKFR